MEGLDYRVATELSMNDHNADGSCSAVEEAEQEPSLMSPIFNVTLVVSSNHHLSDSQSLACAQA